MPYYELLNTTDKEPETADTLAGLAGKLGLDPAALEATVAEYNAAAGSAAVRPDDDGRQGDARASRRRRRTGRSPIERGPFVGYPLTTRGRASCSAACGPTRRPASSPPAGAPIPGLYGAGEMTGVFYQLLPVGTSVLRGLTFGRIAGAHAATRGGREVAAV